MLSADDGPPPQVDLGVPRQSCALSAEQSRTVCAFHSRYTMPTRSNGFAELFRSDKVLRRYAVLVDKTLASWEVSPQEWADYIAFLSRLLKARKTAGSIRIWVLTTFKAIQAHPADITVLPHAEDIASKLAQCLNPALPSGVHGKALEVYTYIFDTFGVRVASGETERS